MHISYKKIEMVDSQKIKIYNENEPYFWQHHGRRPEEKDKLRYYASILPETLRKVTNFEILNEDEEYSYEIYINNGPKIEYDDVADVYSIIDGSHRMYMLRELGINIAMEVSHFVSFRQKTLDEVFNKEEDIQQEKQEKIKKSSKFETFFNKIFHINSIDNVVEKIEEYSNVIDRLAILDNEINRRMLYELGVDTITTYDKYLVVDNSSNLEQLIALFPKQEVLVSTEKIRYEER